LAAGVPTREGKIKAPPPAGRMWLVGLKIFDIQPIPPAGASARNANDFNVPSAIPGINEDAPRMTTRDEDFNPRAGRIRHGNQGAKRPKSFAGEVMRAVKKAGHRGPAFGQSSRAGGRSTFGRGRRAALSLASRSPSRRVVVMARIVRQRGGRLRSAPLSKHVAYLKREGVTRDGADARMFDQTSDDADTKAFVERCEEDRHHFRFTVSPEDASQMADLRAFTRELMTDAETDLGAQLDWVAVDHWNTDNPHIHILVRGCAGDERDLVISRDYISNGLRGRAAERVTLELGPRSELEIRDGLEKEVEAERWTSLDPSLRHISDEGGGVIDLRPVSAGEDPELRRLMIGRAAKLERLGLAEQVGPAQWILKPGIEPGLRDLGIRGDVIKRMHRAVSVADRQPDVAGFALHGDEARWPVLGRLVERGLHDELKGAAYAIIEGIDGGTHHLVFSDLEMTGDAKAGAVVETRAYDDATGHKRLSLATRSDLTIEAQVSAPGATWMDRQLLAKESALGGGGFGAEVHEAMARRIDHLVDQGLAQRQGQRVIFARDLLRTLRRRELDEVTAKLSADTGLAYRPSAESEHVTGIYRQRVTLASGRFAMIDDGLGFQLVPWRPALEQRSGQYVSGTLTRGGGMDWSFQRKRGIGLH
jgi:type IV secretory pathway VirD2 relaxase